MLDCVLAFPICQVVLGKDLLAFHEVVGLDGPVDEGHGGLGKPAV